MLPIGVQYFRRMRENGYYYVDKTAYIQQLVEEGRQFVFLSRPRRFGKSLFVDTLKEAFEGNETLFEGLSLHGKWDWSKKHPVIHMSFGGGKFIRAKALVDMIDVQLRELETEAGLPHRRIEPAARLYKVITRLHKQTGMDVVVLVDEYDKPILDALGEPDIARDNRDELGALYGVLKDLSGKIHFSFFTGVSRFAKTSLFSGMNQFHDITTDPKFSAVCGYTESDIEAVFAPELGDLDRDKIREWYNGYSWRGKEKVYNPYDILYLLENRLFEPWWFITGSPKFMIETLKLNDVVSVDLNRKRTGIELFDSFDIEHIDSETLLFQAGYLTISEEILCDGETLFVLDYPNKEVRQHLNVLLLDILAPGTSKGIKENRGEIARMLQSCDDEKLRETFQTVFAGIFRQWHSRADLTKYEAYVASVFYSYFMGAGQIARAEEATSNGRLDLSITGPSFVYLFEFKMVKDEATGAAIEQIQAKDYAKIYRNTGKSIYLVGVEFSRRKREIVGFDVKADGNDRKEISR